MDIAMFDTRQKWYSFPKAFGIGSIKTCTKRLSQAAAPIFSDFLFSITHFLFYLTGIRENAALSYEEKTSASLKFSLTSAH
jgi:hypothetical protein